ncbi:MAG TPA: nuclear transport factor 2 family protein [Solirubrobacteraceae bacterium]|nr:nuclear transport factor 2 family protein [Solirubrobacteraceae bacterium]
MGAERLTRAQATALAERYVGAYNARDLDGMLEVLDESIVSHPSRLVGATDHEGHDGVRAWWKAMEDRGDWYEVGIREIRQPDPDRVAILGDIYDEGERVSPWCLIMRIRGGLIVESHSYLSDADLLDRLGLMDPEAAAADGEPLRR